MSSNSTSSQSSSPETGGVPLSPTSTSSPTIGGVNLPFSHTQFVLLDPTSNTPSQSTDQTSEIESYTTFLLRIRAAVNEALVSIGPPPILRPEYQSILNGAIAESQIPSTRRTSRSPVIDHLEDRALARGMSPEEAHAEAMRGWGEHLRAQNAWTNDYFRRMVEEGRMPGPPTLPFETPRQRAVTAEEEANEDCICGICLDPMGMEGDMITVLPCVGHERHFYHSECIDIWMAGREDAKRCPLGCPQRVYDELYD